MSTTSPDTHAKLRPPPLAAARWSPDGFWGERFARCRDVMVPAMGRLMLEDERVRWIGNFEVAAGMVEGRHRGPRWNDGDFYKWLEAAAAVYAVTKDAALGAQLDAIIDLVARVQDPDGYIHTDVQIVERGGAAGEKTQAYIANAGAATAAPKRFGNPMDFEMYNHGHLITAACVHHAASGKTNFLAVAVKAADFLAREFDTPTPDRARHGICPSHLMALIDLHRTTGEPRYRDLAKKLLDMRDLVARGDDDNQDRVPFRKQTTAHGHAVRATYLYAGAADVYATTGDTTLL